MYETLPRPRQCWGRFAPFSPYYTLSIKGLSGFGSINSITLSRVSVRMRVVQRQEVWLDCHWTHSAIVSRNDIDVQYTYLGGHICMSANLRTRRYPDPTVAANGSMCDENKVNKIFT